MRFEFHPEALAEFLDATRYYTQSRPGAGDRFVDSVEETIGRIVEALSAGEYWKATFGAA